MSMSVIRLANEVQSESDAWLMFERFRWAGEPRCEHCGCTDVAFIRSEQRRTRDGKRTARAEWRCHKRGGGCGKQFTVLTGTPLEGTHISLRTWLFVLFEMVASRHGVSKREIVSKYGLTAKTVRSMFSKINAACPPTFGPPTPWVYVRGWCHTPPCGGCNVCISSGSRTNT